MKCLDSDYALAVGKLQPSLIHGFHDHGLSRKVVTVGRPSLIQVTLFTNRHLPNVTFKVGAGRLLIGFWKHHSKDTPTSTTPRTNNDGTPLKYSGQTSTAMGDEGIDLVHIEVDGVGGSVGCAVGVIVVHTPVVASNREGADRVLLAS